MKEAKEKEFVMGGVHEFLAWALFTEKKKDEFGQPRFNGSLRSQHTQITDIAMKYHGGGHRYACGVKDLTLEDIDSLHILLDERRNRSQMISVSLHILIKIKQLMVKYKKGGGGFMSVA